jgi:hypothetical protein
MLNVYIGVVIGFVCHYDMTKSERFKRKSKKNIQKCDFLEKYLPVSEKNANFALAIR